MKKRQTCLKNWEPNFTGTTEYCKRLTYCKVLRLNSCVVNLVNGDIYDSVKLKWWKELVLNAIPDR